MAKPMSPFLLQVLFLFSLLQSVLILHVAQGLTFKVQTLFPPYFSLSWPKPPLSQGSIFICFTS